MDIANVITMSDFSNAVFNYQREVIGYIDSDGNFIKTDTDTQLMIPLDVINSIIRFVPDGLFFRNDSENSL